MNWIKDRFDKILKWEKTNPWKNFIDENTIEETLKHTQNPSKDQVLAVIKTAKANAYTGKMLSLEETAILLNSTHKELDDEIFKAATFIKEEVYGNRIVLFSPLYISSPCVNNCTYCGFRSSNDELVKKNLDMDELKDEVLAMLKNGQKRLIAVYGEHPKSDYNYIAKSVRNIYSVKFDKSEIRRVNINAAPMFEDEYKTIKAEGIGTYQVFQETYHRPTYSKVHPKGTLKGEYDWRVFSLHRALNAGLDDVAVGVLFGLYDYKFELLAMLCHAYSLEENFGVGPHTMSFPRIKATSNKEKQEFPYALSDEDFIRLVAIVRLMCPFTGTILTAREEPELRDEILKKCGVSQTDAGTNIAVGGYSHTKVQNDLTNQQFETGDTRSIDEFILSLVKEGKLPSFCTSCYREGRTGCNFMPLAKHAKIKHLCIPNGILTFKEYIRDYASDEVKELGENLIIPKYLNILKENLPLVAEQVEKMLTEIDNGGKDCHL
ncbi:[FeFe] hydrogenase H-cluster radical SAM maturase HydG [Campylobacter fetus]|uniref:[FeFe] hydrogenase H-cluster radical SAM maturase HydG n=1 Tax=Campylobacter fetus TaxID=196 RepID=UPI00081885C5|nr:[FeFe] hydrogenase H-cluster radical SAM maturase HydG [Campylobacter fetus]OCR92069.1 thiamine biosynthesis protein ThiH [Campylobacter fetus subsp. testudinum]